MLQKTQQNYLNNNMNEWRSYIIIGIVLIVSFYANLQFSKIEICSLAKQPSACGYASNVKMLNVSERQTWLINGKWLGISNFLNSKISKIFSGHKQSTVMYTVNGVNQYFTRTSNGTLVPCLTPIEEDVIAHANR